MKLFRFEVGDRPRLGVEKNGVLYDAAGLYEREGEYCPDVVTRADLKSISAAPQSIVVYVREMMKSLPADETPDGRTSFNPARAHYLAPIGRPGKVICVGLNYRDHCEEQHIDIPTSPVLFAKATTAVCGHGAMVQKPTTTEKMDYEGELAVVIGRGGKCIPRDRALEHVFGYTIVNDITARDLQKSDGQWYRAKSQDGFCPMGPCVVTADEIPDPQNLTITTRVNGEIRQQSNTKHMVFGVADLISIISEGMTLESGDVISTGTPGGVGVYLKPPQFLKPGDVTEIEIDGLGLLRTRIV